MSDADDNAGQGAPDVSVEDRARQMGWVSQDEFKGDKSRWRDAETFVNRAENELPLLRAEFRRTQESLNEALREIRRLGEAQHNTIKQAQDRAVAEYKQHIEAAARAGDTKAMLDAQNAIEEIRKIQPPPIPKVNAPDPAFTSWCAKNEWYDNDPDMRMYADAIGNQLAMSYQATGRQVPIHQHLEEVTARMKRDFPNKFGNPNRQAPPTVDSGSTGRTTSNGVKDFNNWPEDAKRAFRGFVRKGIYGQKAQAGDEAEIKKAQKKYAEHYFAVQGE